ncbi:MAG: diacylglycerol kinase family protein [Anaerolineales bacterium]
MHAPTPDYPPLHTKLIFNPIAGAPDETPLQLIDVINELQAWNILPEVYLVEPDSDLAMVVQDALQGGLRMFVVCGGDGTIDSVAAELADSNKATLGIIPTGTRNNVALSLGIPEDIHKAAALLRTGRRIRVDLGFVACGGIQRHFLEFCSVGLLSSLYPPADDIQHGKFARIGDLLAELVSSQPAEMHLVLGEHREINTRGHMLLAANMPYIGPHFRIAPEGVFNDGLLDVVVFTGLSKLDLLSDALQIAEGRLEDPRVQSYRVDKVEIHTDPPMPVLADGVSLGEGPLRIAVRRHSLSVMAGAAESNAASQSAT